VTDARTAGQSVEVAQQGDAQADVGRQSLEVAQQGAADTRVGAISVEVAIIPSLEALTAAVSVEVAQQGDATTVVAGVAVEVAQVVQAVDDFPAEGFPGTRVEVAFGYTWRDANPVWTDVTTTVDRETGLSITYGRSDELGPFDSGSCTFRLDNRDRRYDPTHTTGPHYGDLEPIVPVRVLATFDEITYPMFYGYIEGWPQESRVGNRESWTDITANDVLELFAQTDYTAGVWTLDDPTLGRLDAGNRVGGEGSLTTSLSGERVGIILDLVGFPTGLRDIDDGKAVLSTLPLDGSPRAALQSIEEAEAGWLYADPEGNVVFRARNAERVVHRMAVSHQTFTDQDLSMPYAGLKFAYDRKYVYNDVRREREGGRSQAAVDQTSIDRYFRRKHDRTGLPNATDSDTAALAAMFLARYAYPQLRPLPLDLDPGNNQAAQYPVVMGMRLLDRHTLTRTPQEVGDPIADDYRIEGYTHTIGSSTWRTTVTLSPVDDRTYWTLDDATLGLLDSGNLVGA
jgi:hypothetical protein